MISIDMYIIYIYTYFLRLTLRPWKQDGGQGRRSSSLFGPSAYIFPDILVSAYSSQGFGTTFSGKFNHSSHNGRKWTVIRIIWIGYDWISNMVWMIWYDIIWCDMILMWHDTMIWYNIQEYPIYEHNDSISDSHESLGGFPQVLVAPVTHWKVAS